MATKNPYADDKGNPKPGQLVNWGSWIEANGDDSMDRLSDAERQAEEASRQKLQDRMDAERFPVSAS